MITASSLKAHTAKDLAQMAKHRGVAGWHSMRKEQLIRALVKVESQRTQVLAGNGKSKGAGRNGNGKKSGLETKKGATNRRLQRVQRKQEQLKDISSTEVNGQNRRPSEPLDRLVLMVRDPFWLHAYWEISSRSIARARAAMAEQWHTSRPILRVMQSSASGAHAAETVARDIAIHGGVNNWYIDVSDPPKTFRVEIGYLASSRRFFGIARSNSVTTPKTNSSDLIDHNWTDVADNCDKILAQSGAFSAEGNDGELQRLFEERLRRPMGSPMLTRYGVGAEAVLEREREFSFEVDAEMIVFGATQPDAHVMLGGKPVKIRQDGTFTVRMSMSEGRQVLPVVSSSGDGMQQQTIILAIERNTKTLEPVARETK